MSEFKHTPGPWEIVDNMRDPDGFAIYAPNEDYQLDRIGRCFNKFNAHLIAAAPDLLEALQAALSQCLAWQGEPNEHSCEIHSEIVRQARAAIAKATGVKE